MNTLEKLQKVIEEQEKEIQRLKNKLQNVYAAGMSGIDHVAAANYPEREAEAIQKLQKAMDA